MPEYTADHPISTALSPDGATLLVLTSGYNRDTDIKAKQIPALSNEYVFVYDVRRNPPVKRQVIAFRTPISELPGRRTAQLFTSPAAWMTTFMSSPRM